jgi:hypothetical protein
MQETGDNSAIEDKTRYRQESQETLQAADRGDRISNRQERRDTAWDRTASKSTHQETSQGGCNQAVQYNKYIQSC